MAGHVGTVLAMAALAVTTVVVARLMSSPRSFPRYFALLVVSGPVLFERGLLGAVETAAQSAQTALLATAVVWALRDHAYRGGADRAGPLAPQPSETSGDARRRP